MNAFMLLVLLLLLAAAVPALPQAGPPSVTLPPELTRVLTDYEKAWRAGDREGLARLFVEDGFVLSSGRPFVQGRKAIAAFYQPGSRLSLRAVRYAASGGVGYIIGAYADAPGTPDRGKFTLTLAKDSTGRWLIVSDMDNTIAKPGAP